VKITKLTLPRREKLLTSLMVRALYNYILYKS